MKKKAGPRNSPVTPNSSPESTSSGMEWRFRDLGVVIGERAFELLAGLLTLVLLERVQGQSELGVYSYLLAVYHLGGYAADLGIPRYLERETALHADSSLQQARALADAFQAVLVLGLVLAAFCILSAAYDASHTLIQEKMASYLIIGLAIPLRNLNRLRLACLHGHGFHREAAGLRGRKCIVFLCAFLLLTVVAVPASYLVSSLLISEIYIAWVGRRKVRLPPLSSALSNLDRLRGTLREGYRLVFTDDALGILLYIDILVLGVFMTGSQVGVYTETTALARFFLLAPLSIRPLLLHRYCVLIARGDISGAFLLARRFARGFFFTHTVFALFMILFYAPVLGLFFHTQGEELVSLQIFKVLVPGMLFSASATAFEPLHEAMECVDALRRLMTKILVVNLLLCIYLVPSAGLLGASAATTLALVLHFVLAGRGPDPSWSLDKGRYLWAACAAYLACEIAGALSFGMTATFLLLPAILWLLFHFIGFFEMEDMHTNQPN